MPRSSCHSFSHKPIVLSYFFPFLNFCEQVLRSSKNVFLSYSSKCLPTDRKRLSIQSGFSPPGLLCTSCSLPIIAHSAALTPKALYFCCCCLVTNNKELCTTLCDPMDWGWPSSPIHEILQARILEWVATPFTRESSRPRD